MGQFIPIALALAGTAVQQAETRRVERKQDDEAGRQLIARDAKQRQADQRVGAEVEKVAASRADDERAQRFEQYRQTLDRGRRQQQEFTPGLGSERFAADSAKALAGTEAEATQRANLLATIDAPTLQRQNEAFGYARLGTDLGQLARQVSGQEFVNELRLRAIRARPEAALIAGGLQGAGEAMGAKQQYQAGLRQQRRLQMPVERQAIAFPDFGYGDS